MISASSRDTPQGSLDNLSVCRGLRVLLVIDEDPVDYPPTINAARVLAAAGAQVLCIGGRRGPRPLLALPPSGRIEYADFGYWGSKGVKKLAWALGRFRFRTAIAQAAQEFRPDLIIAYDHGAGWAALPLTGSAQVKTVLHIHDNERLDAQSWLSFRNWQWTWLARHTEFFSARVVPERARAEHLRDSWNIQLPFEVVANAPPLTAPSRNSVLRSHLAISKDAGPMAVVVGIAGLLPEIVGALARTRQPWHLAIIGCRYESEVARARAEALRVGLQSRVHVLPHVAYDTMRVWLQGCDVGMALYPSGAPSINWQLMGTGSVKLMEYMAAGIPSIVCSRTAFARLQRETKALKIPASEDEVGIAEVLDQLEPGSAEWNAHSRAAIHSHTTEYNCERQMGRLLGRLYS